MPHQSRRIVTRVSGTIGTPLLANVSIAPNAFTLGSGEPGSQPQGQPLAWGHGRTAYQSRSDIGAIATRAMLEHNGGSIFRIGKDGGEGGGERQEKQEPQDTGVNITALLGFLLAGVRCGRGIGFCIADRRSLFSRPGLPELSAFFANSTPSL